LQSALAKTVARKGVVNNSKPIGDALNAAYQGASGLAGMLTPKTNK